MVVLGWSRKKEQHCGITVLLAVIHLAESKKCFNKGICIRVPHAIAIHLNGQWHSQMARLTGSGHEFRSSRHLCLFRCSSIVFLGLFGGSFVIGFEG